MAEVLEEFDFRRRGESRYPWDQWFDGRIWKLKQGEDFKCSLNAFYYGAYRAAGKRGGKIRLTKREDCIIFQFFRPEEPEADKPPPKKRQRHG